MTRSWRVGSSVATLALALTVPALADARLSSSDGFPPLRPADRTCEDRDGTIIGTDGPDVLRGTRGVDVIVTGGGRDRIRARGGNDLICAGDQGDLVKAGRGDDRVRDRLGADVVRGGAGADSVIGGRGTDTVSGGAGDDELGGSLGNDSLKGRAGDDFLLGGKGVDECIGGAGSDTRQECESGDSGNPVAVDDSETVAEDASPIPIDVLANDFEEDGGAFSIASASDPAHGTVVVNATGSGLTYEPDPHYCNSAGSTPDDGFTYTLSPGGDTASVLVTVICSEDDPVAVDDARTVTEDAAPASIDVLANDTDVDGGPRVVTSVTQPADGEVVITDVVDGGGGSGLTYEPDPDYCNDPGAAPTDDFTYTVTGGSSATVAVTVTCVNDAPVAADDARTVNEDSGATSFSVLSNDTDIESDSISITAVTQPADGTAAVVPGSPDQVSYEPDPDYCNDPGAAPADEFTYTVNGGDTATVAVTVSCANDQPVANDDAETVDEDDPGTTFDVLANDTDADGDPITITGASDPANGAVTVDPAGDELTYTPDPNYCNSGPPPGDEDTFSYTINGGDTATVSVTVNCVNEPPVAVDDSATVAEDAALSPVNVLGNDTDIDGDPITIASATDPANGTVVLTGGSPGAHTGLSYLPDPNYCNSDPPVGDEDTFTYTINGGDTATVAVTVTCVGDQPVAGDDTKTVDEDAAATAVDVLANDADADGDPFTIANATDPANGTVVLTGGAPGAHTGLTYQPDPDYCNSGPPAGDEDTFTYSLNPGGDTATVAVTVSCTEDAADANDDSATVGEDSGANTINVRANDTDIDATKDLITAKTNGANGTVAITNGGADLTYTPNADYCNDPDPPVVPADTFTYTLSGGDSATVTVTVTCAGDDAVAVDDSATVAEDASANTIDVRANDIDADATKDLISSKTNGANGTVAITNAGADLTYTPNADYCNHPDPPVVADDTFTYTLSGGSTATVSVKVTCANDAPTVDLDNSTGGTGSTANFNETNPHTGNGVLIAPNADVGDVDDANLASATITLTNIQDGNAESLSVDLTGTAITSTYNSGTGVLTLTGSRPKSEYQQAIRTLRYDNTANPPNSADRSITVKVNDGDADSNTATATVTVASLIAAPVVDLDNTTGSDDVSRAFTENGGAVTLAPNADVSDSDDSDLVSAEVILTTRPDGDGTESLAATVGATGIVANYAPASGTLTLTNSATVAQYQQVLRTITYNNTSDTPTTTSRSVTFQVNDGQDDSVLRTATVSVTAVNDAPLADDETFNGAQSAVPNTTLNVGTSAPQPAKSLDCTTPSNCTVLTGDSDPETPGAITAGPTGAKAITTADGGKVTLEADGNFTFYPKAGCTDHSDQFDYTLADNDPVDPQTDTGTVFLTTTTDCVWYIDGGAAPGGDGTGDAPFDALSDVSGASGPDVAFDTLFVLSSGNLGGGLTLLNSQRLLSRSHGLTVDGGSTTLVTAGGGNPTIENAGGNALTLASGNTVQGINLGSSAAASASLAGNSIGTATVNTATDGSINNATGGGVSVVTGTLNASFSSITTSGGAAGIALDGVGGTFTGNGGTLAGATVAAVDINAGSGNVSYSGSIGNGSGLSADITNRTGGTISILGNINDTNDAGGGISMSGNTGGSTLFDGGTKTLNTVTANALNLTSSNAGHTVTFANGGLDIDTTSGIGINAQGPMPLNITGAGNSVTATSGKAVDIDGLGGTAALNTTFTSVSSSGSGSDGIRLDDISGTFSAGSGSSISNASGEDIEIAGNNSGDTANVTYDGTISDTSGTVVSVSNQNGGLKDFNGEIGTAGTPAGAVSLLSNTGATIRFDGGVNLSSGATDAFSASGGGTVVVTGSANALATTTGKALNVVNTTIGSANLSFRSIAAGTAALQPANGIVLNGTGTTAGDGSLVVNGNGGTCTNANTSGCSGGTIRNTTGGDNSTSTPGGTGIVLKDTKAPVLTRMHLLDNSNYAIRGTNVSGFTMLNSVVNGTNGTNATTPFDDSSVRFDNLSGSATVTDTFVSGGHENNFQVVNSGAASLNRITFTRATIGANSTTDGNDGILLETTSGASGALNATIDDSSFTSARADLLQYNHNGSGSGDLVITNSDFANNHPAIATGGGGLSLFTDDVGANTTMSISDNTFRDALSHGVLIVKSVVNEAAPGSATLTGTFNDNTIGVSGLANSGSREGSGLKLQSVNGGVMTWSVTNNQIFGYNNFGVEVLAGGGSVPQSGQINTTITGNVIAEPGTLATTVTKQGVHLNIGTVPGDTFNACAVIGGAGGLANQIANSGADATAPPTGINVDVRLRQRQSTTIRLPGYVGGATDTTAVQNFVAANNQAGTSVLAASSGSGGGYTGTGTTCP